MPFLAATCSGPCCFEYVTCQHNGSYEFTTVFFIDLLTMRTLLRWRYASEHYTNVLKTKTFYRPTCDVIQNCEKAVLKITEIGFISYRV